MEHFTQLLQFPELNALVNQPNKHLNQLQKALPIDKAFCFAILKVNQPLTNADAFKKGRFKIAPSKLTHYKYQLSNPTSNRFP